MPKPRLSRLARPMGNCYGRYVQDPRSFDGFAADYDRFAGLEPGGLQDWLVTQLPTRGARALDAGCGSGRYTQVLARRYNDVIGVDISEPLIEIARDRADPNVRYVVSDLMSFNDANGLDLVFSSTTLHQTWAMPTGSSGRRKTPRLLRGVMRFAECPRKRCQAEPSQVQRVLSEILPRPNAGLRPTVR